MTTNSDGTVYIETSVVSYLTARSPRELMAAAWQAATVEWWDNFRGRYQLFTSDLTLEEALEGDSRASARRLAALEGIPIVPYTDAVDALVDVLIRENAVPERARNDALHIAEAAVHGIDYLLTWNFRHLANSRTRNLVHALCEQHGYTTPQISTPFDLMGDVDDG